MVYCVLQIWFRDNVARLHVSVGLWDSPLQASKRFPENGCAILIICTYAVVKRLSELWLRNSFSSRQLLQYEKSSGNV